MILGPNTGPDSPRNNALKTGPILVGVTLNWFLFGILTVQYFLYLNHFARKDRKVLQAIVHFLYLLDTVQSILAMNDAFHWFVFNFGNYETLRQSGLSGIDSPFIDGIIAMIVQFVYCWRIWALSGWKVFPAIVAFLAFVANVNGMVVGVSDSMINFASDPRFSQWYISAMLWLWTSAATDILIATSMVYLLRVKTRHSSQDFKAVIKRLLILILETNTLTTVVAMVTAIMPFFKPLAPPFTNLHHIGGYLLGKLYSNCFMVLLNQRIYYENMSKTTDLGTSETHSPNTPLRSAITSSDAIGEISTIQFSRTSQIDFESGCGVNIELTPTPGRARKSGDG